MITGINQSNRNKVKIRITGQTGGNISLKLILERFCLLRTAREIGDIETVNHYQLGKLKQWNVQYEKVDD